MLKKLSLALLAALTASTVLAGARTPLIVNNGSSTYTPAPGYLYSWGIKSIELGRGSASSPASDFYSPGLVTPSVKFSKVKIKEAFPVFAVGEDGSVWHWGANSNGERGRIADTYLYWGASKAPISDDGPWVDIASGLGTTSQSWGIKQDGTLWTWGGWDNSTIKSTGQWLVQEGSKSDWVQAEATGTRSFIFKDSTGLIYGKGDARDSWGNNTGLLGCGSTAYLPTLTSTGVTTETLVGDEMTTLIDSAGSVRACGLNSAAGTGGAGCFLVMGTITQCILNNFLGVGNNTIYYSSPYPILTSVGKTWAKVLMTTPGQRQGLALATDGTMWTWGGATITRNGALYQKTAPRISPQYDLPPASIVHPQITQIGIESNWVDIALGTDFALAIKNDGSLWAWGDNSGGQLGLGHANPVTPSGVPQRVGNRSDWSGVFAKGGSAFGIRLNK